MAAHGRYQAGAPAWEQGGGWPPGGVSVSRQRASPADAPGLGAAGPPYLLGASRRVAAPCGPVSSAVSSYGGRWILKRRRRYAPGGCRRWYRLFPLPVLPPALPGPGPYCRWVSSFTYLAVIWRRTSFFSGLPLLPSFPLILSLFFRSRTSGKLFASCQNEMGMMMDKPGNTSHRETHFPAGVQLSPGVVDIKRYRPESRGIVLAKGTSAPPNRNRPWPGSALVM